ncbi:hypothetical protein B0T26DRAFT_774633 [Lasiosphaeria miniovina]|uniref:Uncharacterized protein n=1 Tax=Lasiosphaeria miniovina TaxID=1954250 RepID=A0AA40AJK9_9PEZI|nr:uncharacterized protein B0T26DRAFT_774633 [Lasiosphaeria miniovina]KAK0716965.1 hypothetical protein B0T26DRAFT_774633 [Lasiosphaeria miniovina]
MPLLSQHSALDGMCVKCADTYYVSRDQNGTAWGSFAVWVARYMPKYLTLAGQRVLGLACRLTNATDVGGGPPLPAYLSGSHLTTIANALRCPVLGKSYNSVATHPTPVSKYFVAIACVHCRDEMQTNLKQRWQSKRLAAFRFSDLGLDWTGLDERRRDTTQQPALGMDADINAPASMGQWTCRTADPHANEAMLTDDMPPKPGPENKDGLLEGYI